MIETKQVIHSDPEIVSGTPVFVGTRVPLRNLFDYLKAGDPLHRFLDHFPQVSREQAVGVLALVEDALRTAAHARGPADTSDPTAVVHSDPETMGGAPVFVGTRVPVQTLTDHLAGGYGLEGVLDQFPSLSQEQAIAALELAQVALLNDAYTGASCSMSRCPATSARC
jgi:uncharacterized protein (DUF433 family)